MEKQGLNKKEFLKQMCRWADSSSTAVADKWWTAAVEVIIRELYFRGVVNLPGIGIIKTQLIKGNVQEQPDPNTGEKIKYLVPERVIPTFKPCDQFLNDINMEGVTKAYRRRKKEDALTYNDYLRELRKEELMGVLVSDNKNTFTQDELWDSNALEKKKEAFAEKLKERKKKHGRVEKEDE